MKRMKTNMVLRFFSYRKSEFQMYFWSMENI